ncbi:MULTISPECIES: hypothetical protein [Actinomycetes]|uniref:hypothetical protein n=1 Tax=Actinomycetes TaxID=1760 RepID=UPI0033F73D89
MSNIQNERDRERDRGAIATAAIGGAVACLVGYSHPALIPVLGIGLTVWGALYIFLKL